MLHKRNAAGDTIVEVLIAMSIISAVVAGAYATVNASTRNIRQNQQYASALKILQGQVEQLRTYAAVQSGDSGIFDTASPPTFCFGTSGYTTTESDCVLNGVYAVAITRTGESNTFKAVASWDSIAHNGKDSATIYYKVYPGN